LTNKNMKLTRLILTAIFLGLIVGAAIIFWIGADSILFALQSADYRFLALAVVFQAFAVFALCLRWAVVVKSSKIEISSARLLLITLSGVAVTNLTPSSRFGGEPVRAYFLRKYSRANTARAFATVVAERIFDAITFCLISFVALVFASFMWEVPLWVVLLLFISFILCLFLLAVVTYVSLDHRLGMRFVTWFLRRFSWLIRRIQKIEFVQEKLTKDVSTYSKGVKGTLQRKSLWVYGILTSLLIWFFDIMRVYFVFMAFGANVSPVLIAGVLIIVALAGAVPILPGGLGLTETAMILIYTSSNIALLAAGTVTIIDRLISYWGLTFVGLGVSSYLGIEKYEVKKWAE
jgi:uncharacterized protein (TIRG00374 family)